MRFPIIILALASLTLTACSNGAASPATESPTATLSAIERAETAVPGPATDEAIERYRRTVREVYGNPSFNTESFCRSLRGLSDREARDMARTILVNYAADSAIPYGTYAEAEATGAVLKEECARMYP